MKTESAKEWLKENDYPDAMIRTRGNEVLFRTSDAMQAYADQQVKAERGKILQDAIDSVIAMRDRSFNEDYIDAYELVINQLKSLKIKQP